MVAAGDVRARVGCARLCVLWTLFDRARDDVMRHCGIVRAVGVVERVLMLRIL